MADISVIVPVYNGEKTITRCLKSIFNQTLKPREVVVVNDGSTDRTADILKEFSVQIQVINQPNRGASAARNRGAAAATTALIIFCDADIVMEPTMLEQMHQALENHPEASYAYSAFKFGFKTFRLFPFDDVKLKQAPYIHTTSLIRRAHFPGFDENLKRFQDWDLWLTMLEQNHRGCFIPEVLFMVSAGGTMSTWLPSFVYRLPVFKNFKNIQTYQNAKIIIKQKHGLL